MTLKTGIGFLCLLCLSFFNFRLIGQETKEKQKEEVAQRRARSIQVDTTLVAVSVTAADPYGRVVTGLEKNNFEIFEDKKEQKIIHFSNEDTPVIVGFVIDLSGSMGEKLVKTRQAVAQFLATANPEDQFFLIQFSDQPVLSVELTKDTDKIKTNLLIAQARGRTALLDGIYLAVNYSKKNRGTRRALLVISDGGDNYSRYTEREVKSFVKEADTQIYTIGIFEPASARGRSPEESAGPALLTNIAESTGGRHVAAENPNDLPDIAKKISLELRNQYVLYYRPSNENRDGKYRKIRVKLNMPRGFPPVNLYFRPGYYAPSQ